jgi:pyridoxine/pyridoxamine 5'-phosphate oxidase
LQNGSAGTTKFKAGIFCRHFIRKQHFRAIRKQFEQWFNEALLTAKLHEPNAMTLATATTNGKPSARIVLLKGLIKKVLCFIPIT